MGYCYRSLLRTAFVIGVFQVGSSGSIAQVPEEIKESFLQWSARDLHPVTVDDLSSPLDDLRLVAEMVGDARIVGLSESVHASREPLAFRNRLFRYLVEELGFEAIAIESGIVESRVIHDYVTLGQGDLKHALDHGLSWEFGSFRQNQDLIQWVHDYNASLPADSRKIQVFGFDVSGSPANLAVDRGPETALMYALNYLQKVDELVANEILNRVQPFIPALESTDDYGLLTISERDSLSAAIADLVSLIQRRRVEYVAKSSELDYAWGEQSAIAARQVDAWFRRMPDGWSVSDGFEWTPEAMLVRDRAMAENLEWILGRLSSDGRLFVFGAVAHMAASPLTLAGSTDQAIVPFGLHVKARHMHNYVNVLNLVANGEIVICSENDPIVMKLSSPPDNSVEALFSLADASTYLLDLRQAPANLAQWLTQEQEHWNGFGSWSFPTTDGFDIVFYVSPISSDCLDN